PAMLHARLAARRLPAGHYAETTYEAMKSRPEEELGRLLSFIGLPADPETVRGCIARADFKSLTGREPGQEAASYYRKGIVGDWRNHLSEPAADRAVQIGEMFIRKGSGEAPARMAG